MTVAGYTRISTGDQNAELQVRELRACAENHGWTLAEMYHDVMSGAESSRPGLNRLMADARARKIDSILVWKLVDCLNNIRALEENGVRFIAVRQAPDTDVKNPASRFLLHVLGAAAEFERALIRERTNAGRLRYQQDYDAGRVGKVAVTPHAAAALAALPQCPALSPAR